MAANVQWNGPEYKALIVNQMMARLSRAAIILQRKMKELLSISGTGVMRGGTVVRKIKGMKGKTIYGAFPSKPGEMPHKQTGRLRMSITREIDRVKKIARVGTNVPYGRHLALGTSKMKPRPWPQRALAESQDQIEKILTGPLK